MGDVNCIFISVGMHIFGPSFKTHFGLYRVRNNLKFVINFLHIFGGVNLGKNQVFMLCGSGMIWGQKIGDTQKYSFSKYLFYQFCTHLFITIAL